MTWTAIRIDIDIGGGFDIDTGASDIKIDGFIIGPLIDIHIGVVELTLVLQSGNGVAA